MKKKTSPMSLAQATAPVQQERLGYAVWTLRPRYGTHKDGYLPKAPSYLRSTDRQAFDRSLGLFEQAFINRRAIKIDGTPVTLADFAVCSEVAGRFIWWAADTYKAEGPVAQKAEGLLFV